MQMSKKQRREARQRFIHQFKQDNMGNGLDNGYYARMAWDKMPEDQRKNYLQQ